MSHPNHIPYNAPNHMRNLTPKFLQKREKARSTRPAKSRLEEGAPPLGWVQAVAKVDHAERSIENLLVELQEQQSAHLRADARFESDDEEDNAEEKVSRVTEQTTKLFHVLDDALRRVVRDADDQLMLMNVHRGLVTRVNELHIKFRMIEQKYADALKEKGAVRKKLDGILHSEEARKWEEQEAHECRIDSLQEQGYNKFQIQKILVDEEIAREKADALEDIETALNDLHSMFSDLHAVVVEQGSMLDRVDTNIENATAHMRLATSDLRLARKNHKRCGIQ
ncbi:Syntaxin-41 [Diplonema papillatum]|nr:Syntaxin-41 [Diplonema papillatum]